MLHCLVRLQNFCADVMGGIDRLLESLSEWGRRFQAAAVTRSMSSKQRYTALEAIAQTSGWRLRCLVPWVQSSPQSAVGERELLVDIRRLAQQRHTAILSDLLGVTWNASCKNPDTQELVEPQPETEKEVDTHNRHVVVQDPAFKLTPNAPSK
eukprot:SAG31_NODE_21117_length_557_cov_1.334061_2_plen_152_part_01